MKLKIVFVGLVMFFFSCNNQQVGSKENTLEDTIKKTSFQYISDTISVSKKHQLNCITLDMDGDSLTDSVELVFNTKNSKYGLKFIFGNRKIEYLGMGKDVLGQGFDDMNWVGIFEKVSKNEVFFNNVAENGDLISEDEVKEIDKFRLENDGVLIHEAESCGGGVIYWKNGNFEWIQQE